MPFEMGGRRWFVGQRVRVVYPGCPLEILGTIAGPWGPGEGALRAIRVRLDVINFEEFPEDHTVILVEPDRLEPIDNPPDDLA